MTVVNVVAVVSCEDVCILGGRGGGGPIRDTVVWIIECVLFVFCIM